MSLIRELDAVMVRLEQTRHARTYAYAHIHAPSNANKIAKTSTMQSNKPHTHNSQKREQTKLPSWAETALISGGDSDRASTEKDTHILVHTQPHL